MDPVSTTQAAAEYGVTLVIAGLAIVGTSTLLVYVVRFTRQRLESLEQQVASLTNGQRQQLQQQIDANNRMLDRTSGVLERVGDCLESFRQAIQRCPGSRDP